MTKEELEKATGQELIDERNYCGVDGYYGVFLDNVNAGMLKRFNRLAELENKLANADYQLEGREVELKELNKKLSQAEADYDKMFWQKNEIISNLQAQIEKMKCCGNCTHKYCSKCKKKKVLSDVDYWELSD